MSQKRTVLILLSIVTFSPLLAFAGAPDPAQTQYFADVIHHLQEQTNNSP